NHPSSLVAGKLAVEELPHRAAGFGAAGGRPKPGLRGVPVVVAVARHAVVTHAALLAAAPRGGAGVTRLAILHAREQPIGVLRGLLGALVALQPPEGPVRLVAEPAVRVPHRGDVHGTNRSGGLPPGPTLVKVAQPAGRLALEHEP